MHRPPAVRAIVLALLALLACAPVTSAATVKWVVIAKETFESSFPTGKWTVIDRNGPSLGGLVAWDDNQVRAHQGYWAANPADMSPYPDLVDTTMRYGPFSLVGAKDAQVLFWYWMDTEAYYDEFGWQYSCDGGRRWTGTEISGSSQVWKQVNVSLKSCIGKADVRVRWTFRSDYSSPNPAPLGVWVDDVRIRKSV